MHHNNLQFWQHTHAFGQDKKRSGELRTMIVILITGTMMVVEIATGIIFGSMALLADGHTWLRMRPPSASTCSPISMPGVMLTIHDIVSALARSTHWVGLREQSCLLFLL